MIIKIDPVSCPRQTQRDKWNPSAHVLRYRAFCEELRLHIINVPPVLWVTFYIKMPKTWSNKKLNFCLGKPHTSKPDLDNLVKSCGDFNHQDDSGIYEIHARKIWAKEGAIEFGEWLDK